MAFYFDGEQHEFLRISFGLCNGPATFRGLLVQASGNLDGVDDILVVSYEECECNANEGPRQAQY